MANLLIASRVNANLVFRWVVDSLPWTHFELVPVVVRGIRACLLAAAGLVLLSFKARQLSTSQ